MMMIMKTPSLSALSLFKASLSLSLSLYVHSFALLFEDFNALVVGFVWALFLLKQITHTHIIYIYTHTTYTHTRK